MKTVIIMFLIFLSASALNSQTKNDYPITPVDFTQVNLKDGFWKKRIDTNTKETIPFAFRKSEETGRINNFIFAAGIKKGKFAGIFGFDDSDVYKIIEGASYTLTTTKDKKLSRYLDTLISYIARAQEKDGYLYTAWTLRAQDDKKMTCCYIKEPFDNMRSSHELYNAGHMYEAAVAHYQATGKKTFLNVAIKNADLIWDLFGPGQREEYSGHEEIEIGLVKLYRVTGDERYLRLAKLFLDRRGKGLRKYDKNATEFWMLPIYFQDHKPVIEQDEAVGHAVRAGYMYSAMADVAALTGDKSYVDAIDRIWENVVSKKLYITGGIGARSDGEAFGDNYQLPNNSYAETCAAIANVQWNYRMFLLHGESKYIDILERTLYNGLISGVSMDGKLFFYPNPLEHDGTTKFNMGSTGRSPWFDCSCCPSNISRFMPSLPGYIYAVNGNSVYVNLFVNNSSEIKTSYGVFHLEEKTGYPNENTVKISITPLNNDYMSLRLRIPGWAVNQPVPGDLYKYTNQIFTKPVIKINNKEVDYTLSQGYAVIEKNWKKGDKVELTLPMKVKRVIANENVKDDLNKVALEYGPLVYCLEGIDNGSLSEVRLSDKEEIVPLFHKDLLNGVTVLKAEYNVADKSNISVSKTITAVPYFSWNHRGNSEMKVWIPRIQ